MKINAYTKEPCFLVKRLNFFDKSTDSQLQKSIRTAIDTWFLFETQLNKTDSHPKMFGSYKTKRAIPETTITGNQIMT